MKATIEFNLPEDNNEFTLMSNASKWYSLAWELDQHLRAQTKYAPDTMHDSTTRLSRTHEINCMRC